ncbi:MAG: hypothetical protein HYT87_06575 [Nitrospirae bacterium]|nr:hypothetical protein [Nitrospirota bacterium]
MSRQAPATRVAQGRFNDTDIGSGWLSESLGDRILGIRFDLLEEHLDLPTAVEGDNVPIVLGENLSRPKLEFSKQGANALGFPP